MGWAGLKRDNLATLITWLDFLKPTSRFTVSRSRQGNDQKLMVWRIFTMSGSREGNDQKLMVWRIFTLKC